MYLVSFFVSYPRGISTSYELIYVCMGGSNASKLWLAVKMCLWFSWEAWTEMSSHSEDYRKQISFTD